MKDEDQGGADAASHPHPQAGAALLSAAVHGVPPEVPSSPWRFRGGRFPAAGRRRARGARRGADPAAGARGRQARARQVRQEPRRAAPSGARPPARGQIHGRTEALTAPGAPRKARPAARPETGSARARG